MASAAAGPPSMPPPFDQTQNTQDRILRSQPHNLGENLVSTLSRALVDALGNGILEVRNGALVTSKTGAVVVNADGSLPSGSATPPTGMQILRSNPSLAMVAVGWNGGDQAYLAYNILPFNSGLASVDQYGNLLYGSGFNPNTGQPYTDFANVNLSYFGSEYGVTAIYLRGQVTSALSNGANLVKAILYPVTAYSFAYITEYLTGMDLSADALNTYFNTLPVAGKTGSVTITGCTGAGTCDTSIATNKYYSVNN